MDYDMTIHHNPDAQAWAKFFIETTKDMERDVFRDEGYMIAWFANAMMAMHDNKNPKDPYYSWKTEKPSRDRRKE
jgi:hypothetical protein